MNQSSRRLQALESQAILHSSLARALNYPDAGLVGALQTGELPDAMAQALAELGRPGAAADLEPLKQEYRNTDSTPEDRLLELEKDYTRMFFASKPRLAYLFESVYREGKLFEESTFEIARLYHLAGLRLNEDFRLPPDHIAVELEFLSFLYFKEIEGIKSGDKQVEDYARELQTVAVNSHIKPFALSLAERVAKHAKTSFYRTIATVLRQYYSET
jgi:TorA maturation chaperone TorD